MTEFTTSDDRQFESLRCLWQSVASIEVMQWLLKSDQFKNLGGHSAEIDEKLDNIRSFFLAGSGLTRQEVQDSFMPLGSALIKHIYDVLFADAIRWWAAAHRSSQDENKYLKDSMYKGEFVALRHHFYHEFRNNQLGHYPGGRKSNDIPFLTPSSYGFFLSRKEFEHFRSLLAHSITLTLVGAEQFSALSDDKRDSLEASQMPEELRTAAEAVLKDMHDKLNEEILEIPTRDYFPDQDGA